MKDWIKTKECIETEKKLHEIIKNTTKGSDLPDEVITLNMLLAPVIDEFSVSSK